MRPATVFLILAATCAAPASARAADAADDPPADIPVGLPPATGSAAEAAPPGLWGRDTLTGDWGGWRSQLAEKGLKLSGVYTGEVLGDPSGGVKQRATAEGLLEVDVDGDLDALAGWKGATMHASLFQIHGRGLSSNFVGNQFTVRDIEAAPSTRLWSLWLQQSFAGDTMSLRVGQMPEQEEFVISTLGAYFMNGTFGWPIGLAANMPSGGGAYPLAMTGMRYKVDFDPQTSWMLAYFDGDPAPGPATAQPDPVRRNLYGLNFSFRDPPAVFTELAHSINQDKDSAGLPTTFKLGGWFHAGGFGDLHTDNAGLSLGNPASTGTPRQHRDDYGLYGIVDHMLWRRPGTDDVGIGIFTRQMVAPPDRNTLPYYGELGLTWKGMLPERDDDVAGLAVAYGAVSPDLAGRDRDANTFGTATAVRDYEMAIETLYRAQVVPWGTLIPNVQYVVHPGYGTGLPDQPGKRIPDAVVVGLRMVLKL